jgi:hypothetical protein
LSRTRTLVLLATMAALALLVTACGGGGDSGSGEDAQQVIDEATLEGVESGNLDLALKVNAEGEESGNADVALSGPFQGGAKGELPEADLEASVHGEAEGESLDFEGGITLLSDRAYIAYEGDEYEVDPTTFGFVKSGFEQAAQESSGEGAEGAETEACQEAALGIEVGDFIENLSNEGGVDVEGTETTEISGDLNVKGAVDQIIELAENPACSGPLEAAGPLPLGELDHAKNELAGAVKKAHASVFVGEDDNIIRKVSAELTLEPEGSGEAVEIDFDLTLSEVNEEQTISAPSDAKPLQQLFQQLGVDPLELLGGGGGIGGLLEGIEGEGGGEGSSGAEVEIPNLEESEAYLQCLQEVQSASDLQKCANKAPK